MAPKCCISDSGTEIPKTEQTGVRAFFEASIPKIRPPAELINLAFEQANHDKVELLVQALELDERTAVCLDIEKTKLHISCTKRQLHHLLLITN